MVNEYPNIDEQPRIDERLCGEIGLGEGEHPPSEDPIEATAHKIVVILQRFDAQMTADGFSLISRRRHVGEVLELVLTRAVEDGLVVLGGSGDSGHPGDRDVSHGEDFDHGDVLDDRLDLGDGCTGTEGADRV